jgi:hypothetical protein
MTGTQKPVRAITWSLDNDLSTSLDQSARGHRGDLGLGFKTEKKKNSVEYVHVRFEKTFVYEWNVYLCSYMFMNVPKMLGPQTTTFGRKRLDTFTYVFFAQYIECSLFYSRHV